MATLTTNYQLKKPGTDDFVSIEDINGNMDILDEKIHDSAKLSESNTFLAPQTISDKRTSAGYGSSTFIIDSNGLTNVPAIELKNQGEGISGMRIAYKSGGSAEFGNITGGSMHFGSVNRPFVFTENNQAYASGPAFTFERTNVPAVQDSIRINANTAVTGYEFCIYEARKFLFGIEGTSGRMTDGTTAFTTTEIKNEVDAKQKAITISTSEPTASDGVDGDIWMVYE